MMNLDITEIALWAASATWLPMAIPQDLGSLVSTVAAMSNDFYFSNIQTNLECYARTRLGNGYSGITYLSKSASNYYYGIVLE